MVKALRKSGRILEIRTLGVQTNRGRKKMLECPARIDFNPDTRPMPLRAARPSMVGGSLGAARGEQVAGECADRFQRSRSGVEGRNGQLTRHHPGHHRLSDRKLAALTALHNYPIRRPDGTTAAAHFFGCTHETLFALVLQRMSLPPRPARRRTRPPKPPYLMPRAA
jgi:hypothetical protein